MEKAINLAKQSGKEIPVGAIIVKNKEIISMATNSKEKDNDVTSHAEILAIRQAEEILNNWRLEDCDMYVTLEPCPMCGWAILQARIKNLYFGSYDCTYGAFFSKIDLRKLANSKLKVYGGIMEKECDKILEDYFQKIRK
jgi:tRNA(adenine34) deaminase